MNLRYRSNTKPPRESLRLHLLGSLRRTLATIRWLMTIMIPASTGVFILQQTGALQAVAEALEPLTALLGLPGGAALALLSSVLVNLYAVVAIMAALELTVKQVTVLALVCLIAHNYLVELAVTRKTGTSVLRMFLLRTGGALLVGWLVTNIVPDTGRWAELATIPSVLAGSSGAVGSSLVTWLGNLVRLIMRVTVIITTLTFVTRWLHYIGVTDWIAHHLRWPMAFFGLPAETGPAWVVANTLGLAYGAAVLAEEVDQKRFTPADGDLLNHHLGLSHSVVEDTALFAALGAPLAWLLIPRLLVAWLAVWERKLERFLWVRRFSTPASDGPESTGRQVGSGRRNTSRDRASRTAARRDSGIADPSRTVCPDYSGRNY